MEETNLLDCNILKIKMEFFDTKGVRVIQKNPSRQKSMDRKSERRVVFFLFLFSFVIRFAFYAPVCISNVQPKYDEMRYYSRAIGFSEVFKKAINREPIDKKDLDQAYGGGIWPPLHPIVMSVALLIFGKSVAAARFIVLLISAATSPLVYKLIKKYFTTKGAFPAALVHIFYPSFIAYAHYLWPETLYIFLLLLMLYFALSVFEASTIKKKTIHTALTGLLLALCLLTRSAAMPYLVVILLWFLIAIKNKLEKFIMPVVCVLVFIIFILPWQLTLLQFEKRGVLISTTNAFYSFYGNNKLYGNIAGASLKNGVGLIPTVEITAFVNKSINEYAKLNKCSTETAGMSLAKKEILANPKEFFIRIFYRMRMFFLMDGYVLQHILRVA